MNIKLHLGRWPGPVRKIGPIEVRMDEGLFHNNEPQIADMLAKLQGLAAERGANAVIQIGYEMSLSSAGWHTFVIRGIAVVTGITKPPIGTDFESQMAHLSDLLDRGIITYAEYEMETAALRRDHEGKR